MKQLFKAKREINNLMLNLTADLFSADWQSVDSYLKMQGLLILCFLFAIDAFNQETKRCVPSLLSIISFVKLYILQLDLLINHLQ